MACGACGDASGIASYLLLRGAFRRDRPSTRKSLLVWEAPCAQNVPAPRESLHQGRPCMRKSPCIQKTPCILNAPAPGVRLHQERPCTRSAPVARKPLQPENPYAQKAQQLAVCPTSCWMPQRRVLLRALLGSHTSTMPRSSIPASTM